MAEHAQLILTHVKPNQAAMGLEFGGLWGGLLALAQQSLLCHRGLRPNSRGV